MPKASTDPAPRPARSGRTSPGARTRVETGAGVHGAAVSRLRAADALAEALAREGRIGLHVPLAGVEHVLAAVAAAADERDWIFPSRRHAPIALLRGAAPSAWFAQLLGNSGDPSRGRQEPGHFGVRSLRVVVPSTLAGRNLPQAAGAARAMRMAGRGEAAIALAGQAAVADGDFHVGLNFAAVWGAPAVFVVTTDERLREQTGSEDVAIKASAYGMPGVRVDGRAAGEVEDAVREALARARAGSGPTLVEARCAAPDVPAAVRRGLRLVDAAGERARPGEPGSGEPAPEDEAMDEMRRALAVAAALPPVPADLLLDDVFARPTPALRSQRETLRATER